MKNSVSIVLYRDKGDSVAEAIDLSGAFDDVKRGDRVFVKPNIVVWTPTMPPWGVITTTRVVEDVVRLLRDKGAGEIVIGEGIITIDPDDKETPRLAFESLGYNEIARKYDANIVHIFEREFRKKDLGDGIELSFSTDFLDSDFVVSIPVLKTHAQTMVSLSYKNLKGVIDMKSRKRCHSPDMTRDLDFHISKLADRLPRSSAVIDGIYTLERGPTYSGSARRSNILIASGDMLSADMVGAGMLGMDPAQVPSIQKTCRHRGMAPSLKSVEIEGEPLEMWASKHEWDFPYNEQGTLPIIMDYMKIKGLCVPKYDHSLCSYCSGVTGMVQAAVTKAWKGIPFDNVEILTGKMQLPSPGMNHTVLLGKCQVELNEAHPNIRHAIRLPGCPPKIDKLPDALKTAGIEVDKAVLNDFDSFLNYFMGRYKNKPEFTHDFYKAV